MTEDPEFDTLIGLIHDEHARQILVETSVTPRSASELAEQCDASRQTIYRRLNKLQAANFVAEQTRPRKDGHHDTVYIATLDSLLIELDEGTLSFDIDRSRSDAVDALARLWRNF